MRKLYVLLTVALFFVLGTNDSLKAQLKLGYINSGRLMAEYEGFKKIADQLQTLAGNYEKEMDQMNKDFEAGAKEFENQQLLLSDERKAQKQRELQEQYQKLQTYREQKFGQQGELAQKRQELSQPIVDKIQAILDEMGKKDSYDFIFDTINGNIVYAREEKFDLTNVVLEKLKASKIGL